MPIQVTCVIPINNIIFYSPAAAVSLCLNYQQRRLRRLQRALYILTNSRVTDLAGS